MLPATASLWWGTHDLWILYRPIYTTITCCFFSFWIKMFTFAQTVGHGDSLCTDPLPEDQGQGKPRENWIILTLHDVTVLPQLFTQLKYLNVRKFKNKMPIHESIHSGDLYSDDWKWYGYNGTTKYDQSIHKGNGNGNGLNLYCQEFHLSGVLSCCVCVCVCVYFFRFCCACTCGFSFVCKTMHLLFV